MDLHPAAYVRSEKHGAVTTIEFHHPAANALPGALLRDLATHIHAAGLDAATRVIRLQSGGEKAFCAGAFFDEMKAVTNKEQGEAFFSAFAHVLDSMRRCPKFIIVRVQGKAVGGGVGLIAAADYAIALSGADVKLSELAAGIGPFVIAPFVERKIGLSAFSQLAIDAHAWRSAEWAHTRGLYAEVHGSREHLEESLGRLLDHLCHSRPEAMKAMKEIFWEPVPGTGGTPHTHAAWEQLLAHRAAISGGLAPGAGFPGA